MEFCCEFFLCEFASTVPAYLQALGLALPCLLIAHINSSTGDWHHLFLPKYCCILTDLCHVAHSWEFAINTPQSRLNATDHRGSVLCWKLQAFWPLPLFTCVGKHACLFITLPELIAPVELECSAHVSLGSPSKSQ